MKTAVEMAEFICGKLPQLPLREEYAVRALEAWRQEIRAGAFLEAAAIASGAVSPFDAQACLETKAENEK
jgi:hypothetical protein